MRSTVALEIIRTEPVVLDWSLNLERTETILARDYWLERRRELGRMPSRADLSPTGMRNFVSHVGLIEVQDGESQADYVIRLAGTKWEEVFGPMKGKRVQEFLPPLIEERWRIVFNPVCARKEPVKATTQIAFKDMRWLRTEMFVAPLADAAAGGVAMLLICFASWSSSR